MVLTNDPGGTRTCNPRLRRPMPYPLGHGANELHRSQKHIRLKQHFLACLDLPFTCKCLRNSIPKHSSPTKTIHFPESFCSLQTLSPQSNFDLTRKSNFTKSRPVTQKDTNEPLNRIGHTLKKNCAPRATAPPFGGGCRRARGALFENY